MEDLRGCSLADALDRLERGKIGHGDAMRWLNIESVDELVEIMHVNGRLMPAASRCGFRPRRSLLYAPSLSRPRRRGELQASGRRALSERDAPIRQSPPPRSTAIPWRAGIRELPRHSGRRRKSCLRQWRPRPLRLAVAAQTSRKVEAIGFGGRFVHGAGLPRPIYPRATNGPSGAGAMAEARSLSAPPASRRACCRPGLRRTPSTDRGLPSSRSDGARS